MMKVSILVLLISCVMVAKCIESGTNQSSLENHIRMKRSFGVDKNVKREFEIKTKYGTTFKFVKSVTYNDGGSLTLLPALLDSYATNYNRIISQLQHHKHGYHSQISPNHNTGLNDQTNSNAVNSEFGEADLNNLIGQARNAPIEVDAPISKNRKSDGHGWLRRHSRDVHHKVHVVEHKVHHHIKHHNKVVKHQIKHLGHKVNHHVVRKRLAVINKPEDISAVLGVHLAGVKELIALKERVLIQNFSQQLMKLSDNVKIGPPCCPDGPCCPENQG